jgi:hypothetical protein
MIGDWESCATANHDKSLDKPSPDTDERLEFMRHERLPLLCLPYTAFETENVMRDGRVVPLHLSDAHPPGQLYLLVSRR